MIRLRLLVPLLLAIVALYGCADNIASIWNRGGGGSTAGSGIEVVPQSGRIVDGRPRVEEAFPAGSGWPVTVPILVVFNESIARSSVEGSSTGGGTPGVPGQQGQAGVSLRLAGTTQAVPVTFQYLLGDRAVLLTPATPLPSDQSFEVVVGSEVRDVDAIRKGGSAEDVVATFRTDLSTTIEDGQIVATLPLRNVDDVVRETPIYTIFDRPVDVASVDATSFCVQVGGVDVAGTIDFPLRVAGAADPRVLRFLSTDSLAGGARHEIVVTDAIKFGAGSLDFGGRTPFSGFDTVRGAAPTRVAVGNASVGFPNQINATNFANPVIDVDVDDSVPVGSRVVVRIYGLDVSTTAEDDLGFIEVFAEVLAPGPTTVSVPLGAELGTADRPRFEEGELSILVRVEVDRAASSYATTEDGSTPRFDITPPQIDAFLPSVPGSSTDVVTDQESIAVVGRASEPLAEVELSAGSSTVTVFGSNDDGTFVMKPLALGRLVEPLAFTMSIRDAAGNTSPQPINGRIVQRGFVTGVVAGTLTVEVYDDANFAPVPGALVVVDPDLPQKPAVGRRTASTGVDGRASLAGLTAGRHTITVVADGYHLTSVFDTPAAFASLPIRPLEGATASLTANLAFLPTGGQSGLVGCNAFDDDVFELPTAGSPPVSLTTAAVRAGRPLLVNALTGVFPPTALPAFSGYACVLCGADGLTKSAPVAALEAGAEAEVSLAMLPGIGTVLALAAPYEIDFAAAAGLGAISESPVVRVHGTLAGFGRSALFGAGLPTVVAGARYSINASYASSLPVTLAPFGPTLWVTTEARDADGNVSRHRQLLSDPRIGFTFPTGDPLGVPTIAVPGAATDGAPSVTFEDRLDPLTLPGGVGFFTLRVVDPAARRWTLLRFDTPDLGPESVQLPDLTGLPVAGLAAGAWRVVAEADLLFSGSNRDGDFCLEERRRQQVKFSRSAEVVFEVR